MSYHGRSCSVCGKQHGDVTAHVINGRTMYVHHECMGESHMQHTRHYQLVCPSCRKIVEECEAGCKHSWFLSFPARVPCKECTSKLSITHCAPHLKEKAR